jgi:molybdopterin-guanine dinucleotide biosynthesis adapter protein
MRVFGLAGWSGSGKTTLVTRLIPALVRYGISVSTVKHAHHEFDIDRPGKDSFRHREAGATEVLIGSATRWALMHENRGGREPTLDELLAHMSRVDLVLVEGFKRDPIPKLEVHRPALGKPLLCRDDPYIVAVASDVPLSGLAVPVLPMGDAQAIAAFILTHCRLEAVRGAAQ